SVNPLLAATAAPVSAGDPQAAAEAQGLCPKMPAHHMPPQLAPRGGSWTIYSRCAPSAPRGMSAIVCARDSCAIQLHNLIALFQRLRYASMPGKAKPSMIERADPFEWSGGHPALDLVNTLDERPFESPIENLATYQNLVHFAELAKLIDPSMA